MGKHLKIDKGAANALEDFRKKQREKAMDEKCPASVYQYPYEKLVRLSEKMAKKFHHDTVSEMDVDIAIALIPICAKKKWSKKARLAFMKRLEGLDEEEKKGNSKLRIKW